MLTLVNISAVIVLSIVGWIIWKLYDKKEKIEKLSSLIFIGIVVTFFGLIFFPMAIPIESETELVELKDITIYKTTNSIILEITKPKDVNEIIKFNSYDAVTLFNNDTKYFTYTTRSFYHVNLNRSIIWSNPPYTKYHFE